MTVPSVAMSDLAILSFDIVSFFIAVGFIIPVTSTHDSVRGWGANRHNVARAPQYSIPFSRRLSGVNGPVCPSAPELGAGVDTRER